MPAVKEVLKLSSKEGALTGQDLLDALAQVPPEKILQYPALAPIISSATQILTPLMIAVTAFNAIMQAIKTATEAAELVNATISATVYSNPGPATEQSQVAVAKSQVTAQQQAVSAEKTAVDSILNLTV